MKISKPNEPVEAGILPDGDEIVLTDLNATYCQQADSCDGESDDFQKLKISTQDAGGGFFFIIETKRWAVDSGGSLDKIIDDFKKRLGKLKV